MSLIVGILASSKKSSCTFPSGTFADGNAICDWSFRYPVTIDSSNVSADLTDYLLYIDLSDLPSTFFSNVKSDGGDIRITTNDGITELENYVGSIDTIAETGTLWVRYAGTLSSTVNTTVYIYFGNSSATSYSTTSTYGRNATFQDYEAFWDFEQDPSGSAPQLTDLTGGQFERTAVGSWVSNDKINGNIGSAWQFDGNDEYVGGTGSRDLSFLQNAYTLSIWAKIQSLNQTHLIAADGSTRLFQFRVDATTGNVRFIRFDAANAVTTNITSTGNYADNTYHLIKAVFDSNTGTYIYVDGITDGSSTDKTNNNTSTSIQAPYINNLQRDLTAIEQMEVSIGYMRSDGLSPDYISTEYANQNTPSTFYIIGTIENN